MITGISCVLGLVFLIGNAMLVTKLLEKPPKAVEEPKAKANETKPQRTSFKEGYSMVMPDGFKKVSQNKTERGYIVYRFQHKDGCRFTFAIIPDKSVDRFTALPKDYSQTLVKSIPELSQDIEGEVDPVPISISGMSATLFRFYEKETYRGVVFTYLMVVMDRDRKLVLKFGGKYGGYREDDEVIDMPDHWEEALSTFRHIRRFEKTQAGEPS